MVFGTPSLLLLGYSFEHTLYYVLPSSLTISALQVWHDREALTGFKKEFFTFTLPPLLISLTYILVTGSEFRAALLIGLFLIAFVFIRLFAPLANSVRLLLEKHRKIFLMCMGLLHGTTNLGGAFLNMYVNGLFHEKLQIRAHIAYAYSTFVLLQLLILLTTTARSFSGSFLLTFVVLPLLSSIIFLVPGNMLFKKTSDAVYFHSMTILMALLGILLVVKSN